MSAKRNFAVISDEMQLLPVEDYIILTMLSSLKIGVVRLIWYIFAKFVYVQ